MLIGWHTSLRYWRRKKSFLDLLSQLSLKENLQQCWQVSLPVEPLSLFSLSLSVCLFPYLSSFHLPSFFLSFFFSFFFLFPFKDCNSLFDFSDMGFLEFGALNLGDHCMTWLCKYIGQTTQSSRGILNFLTTSNFPTFHPLGSNK